MIEYYVLALCHPHSNQERNRSEHNETPCSPTYVPVLVPSISWYFKDIQPPFFPRFLPVITWLCPEENRIGHSTVGPIWQVSLRSLSGWEPASNRSEHGKVEGDFGSIFAWVASLTSGTKFKTTKFDFGDRFWGIFGEYRNGVIGL